MDSAKKLLIILPFPCCNVVHAQSWISVTKQWTLGIYVPNNPFFGCQFFIAWQLRRRCEKISNPKEHIRNFSAIKIRPGFCLYKYEFCVNMLVRLCEVVHFVG